MGGELQVYIFSIVRVVLSLSLKSQLGAYLDGFMCIAALLLEILADLVARHADDAGILDRRGHLHLLLEIPVHRVLHQLSQHPPQRFARAGFGDHAFALHHAAERRDGADLGAHQALHFAVELWGGHG